MCLCKLWRKTTKREEPISEKSFEVKNSEIKYIEPNLFISHMGDCYLRLQDLCKIFDLNLQSNSPLLQNIHCVNVGPNGYVLDGGPSFGLEPAYNFNAIEKIYTTLSLNDTVNLNKIRYAYQEARKNAGLDM